MHITSIVDPPEVTSPEVFSSPEVLHQQHFCTRPLASELISSPLCQKQTSSRSSIETIELPVSRNAPSS
jgi:hypothetical protein